MQNSLPIESHPFGQFLLPHSQVLMMGTMPPTPDKWCMNFHYPNFYNDMWRIFGEVFFADKDYFRVGDEKRFDAEKIKAFLTAKGIGECPTVNKAIREKGNAADEHLTVVETVDLTAVLPKVPAVTWLFTTGGKATEVLISVINAQTDARYRVPKTNAYIEVEIAGRKLGVYRLPSSSRAYPLKFEKKVAAYQTFFELAGLL